MSGEKKLYIDGEWIPGAGGVFIDIENPATGEIIARVPRGTEEDVNKAVAAARRAFERWRFEPVEGRVSRMKKVLDELKKNRSQLEQTIISEIGVPPKTCAGLHIECPMADIETFIKIAETYPYEERRGNAIIRREPQGVVAGLTPWNYPLEQIEKKVVPALLAGNCVVLKPSQQAPLTAYFLAELIDRAGFPKGVFNLVTGTGGEVGNLLAAHPDVDMVSFTGSTSAGREVGRLALGNIKKIALELGGKSAAVILPGGDYELAVKTALDTVYLNAGQTCNALTRLIIPRREQKQIEEIIIRQTEAYVFGPSLNEGTEIGTLISKKQYDRVREYIKIGVEEGATMLLGEIPPAHKGVGYYIRPVVFTGVTSGMRIAREEIFGPVLAVLTYDTGEEAVKIANDCIYGLGGAVFGPKDEAVEVAGRIRTGTIFVNDGEWEVLAPYGGYRQSGIGRESGVEGYEEYLEIKSVYVK